MTNKKYNIRIEDLMSIHIPINRKEGLPFSQSININSIKKSSSIENYEDNSLIAILKKIEHVDNAFLNSILSYAVYKDKMWTLTELDKDMSEMTVKFQAALQNDNDLYNLKLWHFNKSKFQPLKEHDLINPRGSFFSEYGFKVNFEFKNGQYSACNDLAHASVLLSNNPRGNGKILHLTFRGTDFSRLPAYIRTAYPDMTAYYQHFLPLEKAILKYVNDPKNEISEIQVSGHSLGGAMVQEFLSRNPENNKTPPIKGYTYGSPGSKKNLFIKFLNIGYHLVKHQTFIIEKEQDIHDPRLNEFYHSNDPVPRIGLLGYKRNGTAHNLFDRMYEDAKEANLEQKTFLEKVPLFGKMITSFKENILNKLQVKFHDSKRYTLNTKEVIEEHYILYPHMTDDIKNSTIYWKDYIIQETKFKNLTSKYKSAFEHLIKNEEPSINNEELQKRILLVRERMHYDSPAHALLSKNSVYSKVFAGESTLALRSQENTKNRLRELREKYRPLLKERENLFKK